MCGIFGFCNYCVEHTTEYLVKSLIQGLRRLEYRGYDSAGLCLDDVQQSGGGRPVIVKKTGNVQRLYETAVEENQGGFDMSLPCSGAVGIAHTRWATHGPPSDVNSHPHASGPSLDFVVVHNGIMTNYREMKAYLQEKGYAFQTETDTEVIAVLFAFLYKKQENFAQLMMEVMQFISGAFAVVVKSVHFPGELCACKVGSPLVVGVKTATRRVSPSRRLEAVTGPTEVFVASDTTPIIEHTKQVHYCEDHDIVHVRQGEVHFYNAKRIAEGGDDMSPRTEIPAFPLPEQRAYQQLETEIEAIARGNYPHFMLKEIHEQPETVVNSMRGRFSYIDKTLRLGFFSDQNARLLHQARRFVFVACGTSLNACIAVRPLYDELAECPIQIENASDFLDRLPKIFRDDVCIFVSQSRETADTLRVLEYCKKLGAMCVGITNTVGSSISRLTDFGMHLNCGPEIGVASTKAYTSIIVCLNLFAIKLSENSKLHDARREAIMNGLANLSADVARTLKACSDCVKEIAETMKDAKSVLVLGRGYQFATALEAALKIKELTYIHTEGINAGELKHGPLALIDEHIPVIIICTKDSIIDRVRNAVHQIRARNGRPIVVLSEPDEELESLAEKVIRVPATVDCLQTVINIIPMQLLSYSTAVLRGNNVDCPRNLAKSVTVE